MMQPLDCMKSRESEPPQRGGERRSAEIIWLHEWRRKQRRQSFRWRPSLSLLPPQPLSRGDWRTIRHRVPIEAWLMLLIVFSAMAGAIFALMGLGYLP